jgi:hypothetical protein
VVNADEREVEACHPKVVSGETQGELEALKHGLLTTIATSFYSLSNRLKVLIVVAGV